jgi:hypothetical protein
MSLATDNLWTFAAIVAGQAWYRIDDVYNPDTRTRELVPYLHHDLDCRWPVREGWQIITRGGADWVDVQPFFDACDGWGASDCPDLAFGHRRPVPICPRCAPALLQREVLV